MNSKDVNFDPQYGTLYLAGEFVPAGTYRNIKNGREVRLCEDGILPPTFDGSVAVYSAAPRTWAGLLAEIRDGGAEVGRQVHHQQPRRALHAKDIDGWDADPADMDDMAATGMQAAVSVR